jgi:hypothetical protein
MSISRRQFILGTGAGLILPRKECPHPKGMPSTPTPGFSAIIRVWVDGDGSSKKAPPSRGFCKQVTTNDQSESSSSLGGTNFSVVAAFCFTSLLR